MLDIYQSLLKMWFFYLLVFLPQVLHLLVPLYLLFKLIIAIQKYAIHKSLIFLKFFFFFFLFFKIGMEVFLKCDWC